MLLSRAPAVSALREAMGRPVVFFGGKGGVGKTTLATASAIESAREGIRTLLVSTDPAHSTSDALGAPLGSDAREVFPGLWGMELDPVEEAERYMAGVGERVADATPPRLAVEVRRQLDIARASPGAEEAALFDRFTRILDRTDFERIVFDTAPSGQTLRLLSLPELMTSWIAAVISQRKKVNALGRMWRNVAGAAAGSAGAGRDPIIEALEERHGRFERARTALQDPGRTAFVFVTLAERLPILETHRTVSVLSSHRIPVGGLIVNQVLSDATADPFLLRRRERQALCLAEIQERFREWPVGYLPLLDHDPAGMAALGNMLDHLRERAEAVA